jgi:2-(1,2-epoxy-1,2-dihydrophenyl)acetyl-CoA isomerase
VTAVADDLVVERDRGVLKVTLDRPEEGNALTPGQVARLVSLFDEAGATLETRAVLLKGAGATFCRGTDARAARPRPPAPPDAPARPAGFTAWLIRTGVQRLITAIRDCEKPVVAAVQGLAADAGLYVVLSCDLVVAAEDARLSVRFVQRGLIPDGGGIYLLPRIVGLQRAKELMLLGDDLEAADALRLGLVNRVVPAAELGTVALDLARRLAAGPTTAIGLVKQLLNRSLDSDAGAAFRDEAAAQEIVMGTADLRESSTSRSEGRPASYRGW